MSVPPRTTTCWTCTSRRAGAPPTTAAGGSAPGHRAGRALALTLTGTHLTGLGLRARPLARPGPLRPERAAWTPATRRSAPALGLARGGCGHRRPRGRVRAARAARRPARQRGRRHARSATATGCCSPPPTPARASSTPPTPASGRSTPTAGCPEHRADLFFRRPGRPGAYGDHATHLVRDGGRDGWSPPAPGATSTGTPGAPAHATVAVTLAETDADLLSGRHVLDTRPLPPADRRACARSGSGTRTWCGSTAAGTSGS